MRKYLALGAVAAIGLLTAATAAPASAAGSDVLTTGSVGGPNVTVGDTLHAGLYGNGSATFLDSSGRGVSCTSANFTASVTGNPAAPGTATESVSALSFSGCTSNIPGVTKVKSITVDNLPYSGAVSDSTGKITITGAVHATIVLYLVIGTATCDYTGPSGGVVGTVSNADNSLTFANQPFARDTGSWSGCPSPENFSAKFGGVLDISVSGSPAVYVN